MPPADNSTGSLACMLYLVFKEPTPTKSGNPLRWYSPCPGCNRFWGNLLRLLQTFSSVNPQEGPLSENRLKTKKLLRLFLGATSGASAGFRLPNNLDCNSIHAPGVGYSNPLLRLDVSGYWLSRLCRATEPRARYLTCCAATYVAASATCSIHNTARTPRGQGRITVEPQG